VRGSTGVTGLALGAGSGSGGGGDTAAGDTGVAVGEEGRKPRRSRKPVHALRMRSREARPAVGVGESGRL